MSLQNSAHLLIASGPCLEVPIAFITASRAPFDRKTGEEGIMAPRTIRQSSRHALIHARENTGVASR